MTFENEKLTVLYGSQTGNAQDLAERIWRESRRFYFRTTIKSLDEYNVLELINEKCVVFVCSTTGQGAEPDNMKNFWKFLLRRNLPNNILSNLRYAVFGLGDSSYTKFNFVAKRLHKRLIQLGANPFLLLGLGDDQHDLGYDAAADPWIEELWKNLLTFYPLPVGLPALPRDCKIAPRWGISTGTSVALLETRKVLEQGSIYYSTRKSTDFTTVVVRNDRLTDPDHFQDIRLVVLQTDGQSYKPGDVFALRPKNLPSQIELFNEVLSSNGIDIPPDTTFIIEQNDTDIPVPEVLQQKVTFEQLCQEYFDLQSIPRRYTFEILAQYTDSQLEQEKCLKFTSAEGQQEFYSYAHRPKRNIVEVLQDFPHATKNLTKEMLFEILPPIKPREFSIASSYKASATEIHILLAVVLYKTKLVKERMGLASTFLANLTVGSKISGTIKSGSFKFPEDRSFPIIMVGPGTGIAPFRNYIIERHMEDNCDQNTLLLFFGCRYKDKDDLCQNDLKELHEKGRFNLITAFSRDSPNKVYVQDKIVENGNLVWDALEKGGYIFVAGNAKNMPQGVKQAFVDVVIQRGSKSPEDAIRYMEYLEKSGRYQTECWS